MPRPLARDPQTGTYLTVDPETNQWRALNDAEFGNLRPSKVLDEMGVGPGERFVLKNFLNPGTASMWLRSRGYEVLPYGSGLNFAVRRSAEEPWRVVDPAKGGVGEFFRDMLDISVGDIALPAVGAALGAAGGPLGAAAGAGGAELARQGIGAAIAGDLGNIDPLQAGAVGAVGGTLPVVGRAAGSLVRRGAGALARGLAKEGAVTRASESLITRITGLRPAQNLSVIDIISARAQTRRPFGTPADVLDVLQRHMDEIAAPELTRLGSMRDRVVETASVNVRDVVEGFLHATGERGRSFRNVLGPFVTPRLNVGTVELRERIVALLQPPTWEQAAARAGPDAPAPSVKAILDDLTETWLQGLESVPAPTALHVRQTIQKFVADRGGFEGVRSTAPGAMEPLDPGLGKDLRAFVSKWTDKVHRELRDQGLDDAVSLDARIHTLASARDSVRHFVGVDRGSAENTVRRAFEPGPPQFMGRSFLEAIKDYDGAFPGVTWRSLIDEVFVPRAAAGAPGTAEGIVREAFIGSQFTPRIGLRETFGTPEMLARPTAVGSPLGAQFITGGALGGLTGMAAGGPAGGLIGAAAGAPLGFLAFSPAAVVRVAPTLLRAGRVIRGRASSVAIRTSPLLSPAAQAAASVGLQGIARSEFGKVLVQNDAPRRQRRLLVGQ